MAAKDDFRYGAGPEGPVTRVESVVTSDVTELAFVSRALYVGVAGDLSVLLADGTSVTIKNASVGWHPVRVRRVNTTATTASQILSWR